MHQNIHCATETKQDRLALSLPEHPLSNRNKTRQVSLKSTRTSTEQQKQKDTRLVSLKSTKTSTELQKQQTKKHKIGQAEVYQNIHWVTETTTKQHKIEVSPKSTLTSTE